MAGWLLLLEEGDRFSEEEKTFGVHCSKGGGRGEQGLHGMQAGVGEGAAEAFSSVAALVEMVFVEKGVERGMEGLDLRL